MRTQFLAPILIVSYFLTSDYVVAVDLPATELIRHEERAAARLAPKVFIEVTSPVPSYIAEFDAKMKTALTSDLKSDASANGRRTIYGPPERLVLTNVEFDADPAQSESTGPFIELQLRERRPVEFYKIWKATRSSAFRGVVTEQKEHRVYTNWSRNLIRSCREAKPSLQRLLELQIQVVGH